MGINERTTGGGLLATGFSLGSTLLGVDARFVQEVSKVGELTPVHGAPPDIVGIRNLRGRIVTVVDLAARLELGRVEIGEETRLLIMERQDESYGFLVDSVTDTVDLDDDRIEPPPANLDAGLRSRLRGVRREEDRLTAVLDPEALFDWKDESADRR